MRLTTAMANFASLLLLVLLQVHQRETLAFEISPYIIPTELLIVVQPSNGRGGSPLPVQPCVAFMDERGRLVNTTANPEYDNKYLTASFEISKLPSAARFAILEQEGNEGNAVTAIIQDGWANFTGIYIDDIADEFQIKFVSNDFGLQTESETFNNTLGDPYELSIILEAGTATGGIAFKPQPIIGIVDKGGNVIDWLQEGEINVTICEPSHGAGCTPNPGGSLLKTDISSSYVVKIIDGRAVFSGLAIDVAGYPYQLYFQSTYTGVPQSVIVTRNFTVGVGRAVEVRVERAVSGARGGIPFDVQPMVSLRDAGGNVVREDALAPPYSEVQLYLSNNPTVALLSSELNSSRSLSLDEGYATALDFKIDKIGQGYQIRFTAIMRTASGDEYTVYTDSDPFDVWLGDPTALVIGRQVGGAYAGGLPFYEQPIVQLVDGGGNVFDQESSAQVLATLVYSPTGFEMFGTKTSTFFKGTARFRSLKLVQVGYGYIVQFTSTVDNKDLAVNLTFDVLPSTEYEVQPDDPEKEDRYGHSVSIFDNTLAVGSPLEDLTVKEVQRVTAKAEESVALQNEVQRVRITGVHRTEIQQITSCGFGGVSARLDGYFTLSFRGKTSRPIRYDIHPEVLKGYLESDIPEIGSIFVEKIAHEECDSGNNYRWTVYFNSLEGEIEEMTANYVGKVTIESPDPDTFRFSATEFPGINSTSVTATNVSVTVSTITDSPVVGGTFRLLIAGDGTPLGDDITPVSTQDLAYDISALDLKAAIETAVRSLNASLRQDVYDSFNLADISRTGPDSQLGYTWDITFPSTTAGVYDWKQIEANSDSLTGLGAVATTSTLTPGTAPLEGQFRMWFKGNGPSPLIDFDESAASFETKLESLDTIVDVEVTRSSTNTSYTWTVTFHSTRTLGTYGFTDDPPMNQPPLKADTYMLRGTGAKVLIEYAYAVDDMDTLSCTSKVVSSLSYDENVEPDTCELLTIDQFLLPEDMPVMGKKGDETGSAYVMYRDINEKRWLQGAKIQSSDAQPYDHFGWAVSYDNSTTATNEQTGVIVVGAPHAAYRGDAEVQSIACYATSGTLAFMFRSQISRFISFDVTAPELEVALESISSITDVTVTYYLGSIEQANELATNSGHTLCQSVGGDANQKIYVLVTFVYPNNGDLPMLEAVTMDLMINTNPLLFDTSAPEGLNGHRCGTVTISEVTKGTILGKSTGEDGYNTGAAYVFLPNRIANQPEAATDGWTQNAKLLSHDGNAGDEFGYSVAAYLDCVVVGAPNHDYDADGNNRLDAAGAVYVYTRDGQNDGEVGVWSQTQKLTVPDRMANDRLGAVLTMRGTTLVVSAPGRNNDAGRVYIFKRQALSLPFSFDQALTAPDSKVGDVFGSSLAMHEQTLIIGAEYADGPSSSGNEKERIYVAGADYHAKKASLYSDGTGLVNCGAVYSYTRSSPFNTYNFHQRLMPRTPRANGRFGHSVAIERDLLIATEQERYQGNLTSRRFIYEVRTYIPSSEGMIGNLFALTWKTRSTGEVTKHKVKMARFSADPFVEGSGGASIESYTDQYEAIQTVWLENDITAEEMQTRIDRDLNAGDILVSRTAADSNGGYTWTVTFVELSADGGQAGTIPLLGAINRLSGGGEVEVTLTQEPLPYIHGMGHVYKRKPMTSGSWGEHAVIRPEVQQDGDLFGFSASLKGRYAVIGAPNRDAFDVAGVNGGAAYVFDMGFVNIRFSSESFTVSEDAGATNISVSRCDPNCEVGHAPAPGPRLDGFAEAETNTIQFALSDGTARSRADCTMDSVGTSECLWLDSDDHEWDVNRRIPESFIDIPSKIPEFVAPYFELPFQTPSRSATYAPSVTGSSYFRRYDYRAQSDYAPRGGQLVFAANEKSHAFDVVVTNDAVLEKPDETVNLLLFSAGMRPLPGGDYWSVLTIEDDGDGGVGTTDTYEQLYASEPSEFARFGSATSLAGDISVIGAPFEPVDGSPDGGAVYIYRRTLAGVWDLELKLTSPNATSGGRFGLSLQTRDFPPHRLIVGAPGESPPAVYIYMRVADDLANPAPINGPGTWDLEAHFALDPVAIADPRCDPENSGTQKRCKNDHHKTGSDSFYAGLNSVALHSRFAVVGAKGLEAVFVYRLKRQYMWYYFQMLKSSDYVDEIYPSIDSEHSKIHVKRPLFGSSVAIYEDTVVVGATLEDHERYEDATKPTDQTPGGITCAESGFRLTPTTPTVYKWTLNEYKNAYTWSVATSEEKANAFLTNDGAELSSQVTCEETNAFMLTIKTNGVPDHELGTFPLNEDTLYAGQEDNPHGIKEQSHTFYMPRFPNITVQNPRSVLQDKNALPRGPIGYALNGVPFVHPFTDDGDDTIPVDGVGYSGHVPDLCNGAPVRHWHKDPQKRFENMYAYRSNPLCLYDQPDEITSPQINTGRLHPFVYSKDQVTNPNPGQRSPKLGYALDGFPIYGPFGENGTLPSDLDACNGRYDTGLQTYVYHITPWKAPYIIGCLRGRLTIDVPHTSNPFPEFMPGVSNNPRDLSFYGRGAVYVFLLESLTAKTAPTTLQGMDISPQTDPFDNTGATDAWFEQTKLTAGDSERGDRFGHCLALEKDQLIISAYKDTSKPRSTWDFETGDLRGWMQTGTAFANQPTFGDNTAYRNNYGDILVDKFRDYERKTYIGSSNRVGKKIDIASYIDGWRRTVLYGPESTHIDHPKSVTLDPHELREAMFGYVPRPSKSCRHKGRFWIGTFENRPAKYENGAFVPQQVEGNAQEDGPQGTLTSDVFPIYGTKISFRIGGGCDIDKVYVELLIDGIPVRRETGKCDEQMAEVIWDVAPYQWQAGTIRIVDASSANWGHINVDDFRFNWDQSYESRSSTPSSDGSSRRAPMGGAPMYSGEPLAGAVYAFRRRSGSKPEHPCEIDCNENGCYYLNDPPNRTSCVWEEQQKLQPSDRRAYEKFGWSVDLDETNGLALVSAVQGRVVDSYNRDDFGGREFAGSAYVFRRTAEKRSDFGTLEAKPYWLPTELLKVQHPDKAETGPDQFGFSVGISGYTLLVGAPSKTGVKQIGTRTGFNPATVQAFPEGGSAFVFDGSIVNVRFKQKEYFVKENHQTLPSEYNRILITVERFADLNATVHVSYTTTDVTAHGVSEAKAAYCRSLHYTKRGEAFCGDYVHQSGVLTFRPEDEEVEFEIRTMNDNCNEHYTETVRLQLGIPGGPALLGEQYVAHLRIDDDDQDEIVNRLFCPQESHDTSKTHPQYSDLEQPDTRGTPARKEAVPLTEHMKWILNHV